VEIISRAQEENMLRNRFENCQSLADVKNVITNSNVTFATLSAEELVTVKTLFKCVMPDNDTHIDSFDYDRVVEAIFKNEEDNKMSNMSTAQTKSEFKTNLELATEELKKKCGLAKEAIKIEANTTYNDYVGKVDGSLNIVKGAFGQILDFIDKQLGFTVLKHNILGILEAGKDVQNPEKWGAMAKTCRKQVDDFIYKVEVLGDPEKAKKLKELVGTINGEDIFTKFFSTIKWITRKVSRKLRKWFHMDDEKSVVGAVARSIAGFAGLLKAGLQIVWSAAGFVTSFVIAGAIQIASWIVNAVRDLVSKVKDWSSKKNEPVPPEDDDEE
jgi:hypothetical protein